MIIRCHFDLRRTCSFCKGFIVINAVTPGIFDYTQLPKKSLYEHFSCAIDGFQNVLDFWGIVKNTLRNWQWDLVNLDMTLMLSVNFSHMKKMAVWKSHNNLCEIHTSANCTPYITVKCLHCSWHHIVLIVVRANLEQWPSFICSNCNTVSLCFLIFLKFYP